VQALDGGDGAGFQDDAVCHALHAEHADLLLHQLGHNHPFKAAVMGVHDVERHLRRVEHEPVCAGHLQHVQVDAGIFMAGEADIAKLPRLPRFEERAVGALLIENAMRVLVSNDLVMLNQIDAVRAEPA
jgi:hypothetical protein